MEIEIIHPNEDWEITREYINTKEYKGKRPKGILLSESRIYQRGKYIIVECNDVVYYNEHVGYFCYIVDAIHYMKPELVAKWKTIDRLVTFRQAIRECTAQGMGLEDLYQVENLTYNQYIHFIKVARVFDERHHGSVTF